MIKLNDIVIFKGWTDWNQRLGLCRYSITVLVCRHLGYIFYYSLSGRRDRRLTPGGVGTPSEEIPVGGFSESSWASLQGQTVLAIP